MFYKAEELQVAMGSIHVFEGGCRLFWGGA